MELLEIANNDPQLAIFAQMVKLSCEDILLLETTVRRAPPLIPQAVALFVQHPQKVSQIEERLAAAYNNFLGHMTRWLGSLFTGPYGQEFLDSQWQESASHVQKRIPPLYTAFAMSFFRATLPQLLGNRGISYQYTKGTLAAAILCVLDPCHYFTARAYTVCLLQVTGVSKALLNRLMTVYYAH